MNDLRIIDADGHVQEKDAPWQDLLEEPYRKHAPRVVKDASGRAELLLEGKIWAKPSGVGCGIGTAPISRRPQLTTGMFDPVQRLKSMASPCASMWARADQRRQQTDLTIRFSSTQPGMRSNR